MKVVKLFLCLSFLLLFNSCSPILNKLYGVKRLNSFNRENIEEFVSKIDNKGIEIVSMYGDSNSYNCIRNLPTTKELRNGLAQPIQILYFGKKNTLESYQANCYAKGGISNLNWNTDDRFSQFVPKSAIEMDSIHLLLNDFTNCLKIKNEKVSSKAKYKILLFWTLMLEKVSMSAIEAVIDNIKKYGEDTETTIYLVNNDKSFLNVK